MDFAPRLGMMLERTGAFFVHHQILKRKLKAFFGVLDISEGVLLFSVKPTQPGHCTPRSGLARDVASAARNVLSPFAAAKI